MDRKEEDGRLSRSSAGPQDERPNSRRLSTAAKRNTLGRSTVKNTHPLFLAIQADLLETVKQLVPSQIPVNEPIDVGKSGLRVAAGLGRISIMKYLIEQGAEVNFDEKPQDIDSKGFDNRGSFRRLPIHDAAEHGQYDAILCLFEVKAKIDVQDAKGFTPLHLATFEGHLDVVKLLCDNGASVEITNVGPKSEVQGETALIIALANDRFDIACELINRGACLNVLSKEGKSPFLIAYEKNRQDVIEAINRGLAKEEQDHDPQSLPTRFIRLGLNVVDECENSLFHKAAMKDDVACIDLLVSLGGDPKVVNKRLRNPLFLAAKAGMVKAMTRLYELGVDHTETDRDDRTPAYVAEKYERQRCLQLLQEWTPTLTEEEQVLPPAPIEEKHALQPAPTEEQQGLPSAPTEEDLTQTTELGYLQFGGDIDGVSALLQQFIDEQAQKKPQSPSQETQPKIQPEQSSPPYNELPTENKLEQIIQDCQTIFNQTDKHQDLELKEFLELLSQVTTLEELTNIKTKSGANFFCMMAKHDAEGKLIPILKQFSKDQIEKLLKFQTANGENCLHIACHFRHLVMFELCIESLPILELADMARAKTHDTGFTPFHLLCTSVINPKIIQRQTQAESKNFLTLLYPREETVDDKLPENLEMMMRRFGIIFGDYPDIFEIPDSLGNTGLMLCTYSLHTTLIINCLNSIMNQRSKHKCILQPNQTGIINPLRYVAAMGDADILQAMMNVFGAQAPSICLDQQLLQWTHLTSVPYEENAPLLTQLDKILEFLITHYFFNSHKQEFTEEFKDLVVNQFYSKTLLLRSLVDCGGALIGRLLNAKHLSRKPDVLFLLMEHMAPKRTSYSPQGFTQHTEGLDSHKTSSRESPLPKPVSDLRRALLLRVFRIDWPESLLNELSLHIVTTLGTPRYTQLNKTSDEKILRIINTNFCESSHQNLNVDYAVLILALFYQVTQQEKSPKKEIEQQYILSFKDNSKAMLGKLHRFYEYLTQQNQKLADQFIEELFAGNSLLKTALFEVFPEQAECLKKEKTNFKLYFKKLLSDSQKPDEGWSCVLQ